MLRHRVGVAGGSFDHIFPDETHIPLYKAARGVPRDLCVLSRAALINSWARGLKTIDIPAIEAAIEDMNFKKWGEQ